MAGMLKRKTSLTLDAAALDEARTYGINVSALADEALRRAVKEARNKAWREENAEAFKAQAEWHEKNGHPGVDIMMSPGADTWKS